MTITSVKEIWQGRGGSGSFEGRTYARVFLVTTDNNFDTAVEATFSGTPKLGDLHNRDEGAFCQDVLARQMPFSPTVWTITASYSSKREFEVKDQDNPLADAARIVWTTEQFQRDVAIDRNGKAVLNSVGYAFDPLPTADDSRPTVNITTNHAAVPDWILDTPNALNSTPVTIDGLPIGKEVAKIKSANISEKRSRNDVTYRTLTLSIHLKKGGWQPKILDEGFARIDPGDPEARESIALSDGTFPLRPVLLNGSGGILANPSTSNAVHLEFEFYPTFDYNNLPLN